MAVVVVLMVALAGWLRNADSITLLPLLVLFTSWSVRYAVFVHDRIE